MQLCRQDAYQSAFHGTEPINYQKSVLQEVHCRIMERYIMQCCPTEGDHSSIATTLIALLGVVDDFLKHIASQIHP